MSITYLKEAVPTAQVAKNLADVKETVTGVIADIRERGDEALVEWSKLFDATTSDKPERAVAYGDIPTAAVLAAAEAVRSQAEKR